MADLLKMTSQSFEAVLPLLRELIASGDVLVLSTQASHLQAHQMIVSRQRGALSGTITDSLRTYHRAYPLRPGMPREELKSKLRLPRSFLTMWSRSP